MIDVPAYVRANARRGLDLLQFAGDGLRPKTVREARAMAAGEMTPDKVRRMAAWLARHESDLASPRADAYLDGDSDRPTAGQVAWLLWGGDIGRANRDRAREWAAREVESLIADGVLQKAEPGDVRVGTVVQFPVVKPPGLVEYTTGIVSRRETNGVLRSGAESRDASRADPAVIIDVFARRGDEFIATDRRVVRLVSEVRVVDIDRDRFVKQVSEQVRAVLRRKVDEHNSEHRAGSKRVTLPMLETVFERGVGAYRTNPGSVRPTVTSADQWAYARVNAFLQAVATGKFPRGSFDTDLLPEGHPLSSR